MAQSILKHPQAFMRELAQEYQIVDEDDILAFLGRYPEVASLLFDIRSNIRRFFGEDPVRLEMFYDPEWPEDESRLIVNIQTAFGSREALDRRRQFGRERWLQKLAETNAPILVSFVHVRRL